MKWDPTGTNPATPINSNVTGIESWDCDGLRLTNYAFNITKAENSTPEVRGDFTDIPQRNGVLGRNNRSYDSGSFSLSMWVVGCNPDGSIPDSSYAVRRQMFERNALALTTLLGAQNRPITLSRIRYGSLSTEQVSTRAYCTGSISIDTMMARQRAELVFTFTMIDSFWTNTTPISLSKTAAGDPTIALDLEDFGNAPVDDSVITITGPVSQPSVTCSASAVSFTYDGNLGAGDSLVVDSGEWTARKNSSINVIQDISHIGHPRFMYLPPRQVPTSPAGSWNWYPTIVLNGTGTSSSTSLSITYNKKYLSV